jgi:opacity protein-like surface antigen
MVFVLSLALCVLLPTLALAQGRYVGVAGGVGFVDDLSVSSQVILEHDNGVALAVNGGYDFGWFRLDLEATRQENKVGTVSFGGAPLEGSGDASMSKLVVNACFEYTIGSVLTPWLGLGIGIGEIEFDDVRSPSVGLKMDDADSGALRQLQLGTAIRFSDRLLGTITYERCSVGLKFTGPSFPGVVEDNFVSQVILFGVRYQY